MTTTCDHIVIGGGIVGLAAARAIVRDLHSRRLIVLEKESNVGLHQSGRNSGVLHSGIYYKPGSLKAITCRDGREEMERFCRDEGIALRVCGKVIVATEPDEVARLDGLVERGLANGVRCERIGIERLREIEPHVRGLAAIHVPDAAVVDFKGVCVRLAETLRADGHEVITNAKVLKIVRVNERFVLETTAGEFETANLVTCAGLYADRVAKSAGVDPPAEIIPFRGEYFLLTAEADHLCRALIYPVPDPRFPFLGVHFTRGVQGEVDCGPNAVFAFAREGYTKGTINVRDLADALTYRGFLRMAAQHWKHGLDELWRSISKRAFVKVARRLVPEIEEHHLVPSPAGVRAMAVAPDGSMLDDFTFVTERGAVHLVNAPSPAATASLAIGRRVAEELTKC